MLLSMSSPEILYQHQLVVVVLSILKRAAKRATNGQKMA